MVTVGANYLNKNLTAALLLSVPGKACLTTLLKMGTLYLLKTPFFPQMCVKCIVLTGFMILKRGLVSHLFIGGFPWDMFPRMLLGLKCTGGCKEDTFKFLKCCCRIWIGDPFQSFVILFASCVCDFSLCWFYKGQVKGRHVDSSINLQCLTLS